MFVRDLAIALPGIHSVITLTPPQEADGSTDKMFAGHGVSVFYADTPYFSKETIKGISGSHVVMHDVEAHQLRSCTEIHETFPAVYYGYTVSDTRVTAKKRFVAHRGLEPGAEIAGPGIDRGEVRKNMQRKRIGGNRIGVGLLYGSLLSYDAALVTDCAYTIDPKFHLMVTNPDTLPRSNFPGLSMTLNKMAEEKRATKCPLVFGNTPTYLNYCQVLIDTGCRRINAEAGAAEIPLLPRAETAAEIHTLLHRFSNDGAFREECSELSRKALRENDIRVTSISIRDALFDVRV